jgi:fluoroacetyl-CoA thioesterase
MSTRPNSHTINHVPRQSDLATAWSNDLPVVATPVLLWLTEICSMKLLQDELGPGEMCVGYGHDSKHLRPALATPELQVSARLESIQRPFATFEVQVTQAGRVIVSGRHTRAIIERQRFLDKLDELRAQEDRGRKT